LGWCSFFEEDATSQTGHPARVCIEHQDRYTVLDEGGASDVKVVGKLRKHGARPAVGDWVELGKTGLIERVLRRRTAFCREDSRGRKQVLAANIDRIFLVTSCNQEFNLRRIERYLTAIADSGAAATVVINKADLCEDPEEYRRQVLELHPELSVLITSAARQQGIDELAGAIHGGETVAFVGSSGVGKSSLANQLLGEDLLKTGEIRQADAKGRHTTTRRELILLPDNRGVLIDTPGMRELRLSLEGEGLQEAFPEITRLSESCRFRNCTHEGEPGCQVRGAVDEARLASYKRLLRERDEGQLRQRSRRKR
jgi:ribosome biogenesis GTPase